MITTPISERLPDRVLLAPNYKLPIVIIAASISIATFQLWVGAIVGLFGIFLSIQTAIIKLEFTTTALDVYRGDRIIRTFPYSEWQNWAIFWQPAPILFYFKEVNSIHFLPIIFDPQMLRTCLEYYRPQAANATDLPQ
jgi:hypothetical protein